MAKTFEKVHACSVGKFEGNTDKIPLWVRNNGGVYSKVMNEDVTHLITTIDAYKKNGETVRKAKRLRTVKIVSYEWIADSLTSKSRKPKQETPYLLENLVGDTKIKGGTASKSKTRAPKPKKKKQKTQDIFDSNCRASKARTEALNYHPYLDLDSGEPYYATLVRPLAKSKERFQLRIYESNIEPRKYATHVKYSRTGKSDAELLAPLGSTRELALKAFKGFFSQKTGTQWEKRFEHIQPQPKQDSEGNVLPVNQGWFRHEVQTSVLAGFLRHGPTDAREKEQALQGDDHSTVHYPEHKTVNSAREDEDQIDQNEGSEYGDAAEHLEEPDASSVNKMPAEPGNSGESESSEPPKYSECVNNVNPRFHAQ
ncbi:hypothetical protein ASPWEDRAFT_183289 [Aspergillus wentii DTO 134E9]|uniref:Uncharacterized protein n=1 Tax=Aspergillus wentii DTO 134E9 TaxID=1073089 RepID=A0A1L9RJR5_ASPWE|nr:uncharacterized protein ASPWEDRAFT_183289 [Aspergillus wentii DTO 134E9]KAI9923830.1 hypothetical protein MW887_008312 [Aspergillus wentii]OJJ35186.1 hypothetical protein ASPWEDRAFT_183289 [Aspergillus wentii DTO 134E9]